MSAEKKNKFRSLAYKLCLGGLTLLVADFGYFFCTPKLYRANPRVKIVKSGWNNTNDAKFSFGPDRLPEECRMVRSNNIVDQAIKNLDLGRTWGEKYNQGIPLTIEQSRARLIGMLNVHPVPKAIMLEILVEGRDPNEAAKIANEITQLYCDFRQSGREKASQEGISSLRAKWEAQNLMVQQAQAELGKISYQINMDRVTNQVVVFDPKDMEDLQLKRITLEDEYVKKKNQFDRLKNLNKDELKDVLSTIDTDTNSILTTALHQLITAKGILATAKATHGTDTPETKNAALAVTQMETRIDGLVESIISGKAADLVSMKASLDKMASLSQKGSHATNDSGRFTAQEANFKQAETNLENLTRERDKLEKEIAENGSMAAVMPGVITTEMVEVADAPVIPSSPDRQIAVGTLLIGSGLSFAGLLLLVLLRMKPRGAEQKKA